MEKVPVPETPQTSNYRGATRRNQLFDRQVPAYTINTELYQTATLWYFNY